MYANIVVALDECDGCVNLELRTNTGFHGKKTVHLDTVTNLVLANTDSP